MKILCLHVPGLHAGYLGCYGNEWVETPHLDRLADEDDEDEEAEAEEEAEEDEPLLPLTDPAVGPVDVDDFVLGERIRCSYAAAVTYLDAGLGLLLAELRRRKVLDELLVVVCSER